MSLDSRTDLKEMNLFELIGILLGDGSIWNYPQHGIYGLEITGNVLDDNEYFQKISDFRPNFKTGSLFMIPSKPKVQKRQLTAYLSPFTRRE